MNYEFFEKPPDFPSARRILLLSADILLKNEPQEAVMDTPGSDYPKYVRKHAKRSPLARDCARAFLVGGTICAAAEGLLAAYRALGASEEDAGLLVSVTLIVLTALCTGIGVFDRLARFAGAGTLVPITGFANAVASCAVDAKSAGWILGVGAKIFAVAGPVIVYGTAAGVAWGILYRLIRVFQ